MSIVNSLRYLNDYSAKKAYCHFCDFSNVLKGGQLFRKIDVNHDGFITIDELKSALSDSSGNIENKELKDLIDNIDIDKNGKINYS